MADAPSTPVLKARTIPEIVDAAIKLYRDNFASFLGIMAIAYVPLALVNIVFMGFIADYMPMGGMGGVGGQPPEAFTGPQGEEELKKFFALFGLYYLVNLVIWAVLIPLATGALTYAVSARYLGKPAGIGSSYGAVGKVFWRYWLTSLLKGLVVGMGMLLCLVPGLIFMVLFVFTAEVSLLERLYGTRAMGRSRELMRDHAGRIIAFGILSALAIGMVTGMLQQGVTIFLGFLVESPVVVAVVSQTLAQVLQLLLQPVWIVAWILIYYDLRIRKEAFDLEVLAQDLGTMKPSTAGPAGPA